MDKKVDSLYAEPPWSEEIQIARGYAVAARSRSRETSAYALAGTARTAQTKGNQPLSLN
ncbi:hypothetical protein [Arcticibacter tournemirensis]|uniref:hypothetical protein n=1 Tax=Arcticibacter tournemirensis TaxID=699437 RepID=UPI0013874A74|nr:hypothetical protein [Arcticibacter tournemirensis]